MVEDAVTSGNSVCQFAFLYDYELEWGKWHRSKERKGGINPFASYMLNKKWTMEEVFNNHMLRFQQVSAVSSIYFSKFYFHIPGWIDSH